MSERVKDYDSLRAILESEESNGVKFLLIRGTVIPMFYLVGFLGFCFGVILVLVITL